MQDTKDKLWTQAFTIWAQFIGHDVALRAGGPSATFAGNCKMVGQICIQALSTKCVT